MKGLFILFSLDQILPADQRYTLIVLDRYYCGARPDYDS